MDQRGEHADGSQADDHDRLARSAGCQGESAVRDRGELQPELCNK
jgi:hypothetical protein